MDATLRPRPRQQQCRSNRQHCRSNVRLCGSNIRHCRKNRLTSSIRQCCWDIVASMDGLYTATSRDRPGVSLHRNPGLTGRHCLSRGITALFRSLYSRGTTGHSWCLPLPLLSRGILSLTLPCKTALSS